MKIATAEFLTSAPTLAACPPPAAPEFAFIGRSNVGKSSLINLLVGRRGLAKVSETPGKTQLINFFSINAAWLLVDLPGYGFAKVSKDRRADFNEAVADYLEQRGEVLRHSFVLIDSRLPPQKLDVAFLGWLAAETAAPYSLVFSKADKQSKSKTQLSVQRFSREVVADLARPPVATFTTSAVNREGRSEILGTIGTLLGSRAAK
ncbi:hypothetical protein AXK11_00870 [Cephaloticoccus primus]|uniref:Probable GTP-binding protein EngB n=1 Tax=Cephaloticoccus primus TaxID=1548207 RepID=A0A139SUG6_9BACT|nr:ribosome biogenesis GTP-binding protein YihA/YsxC [Cephaloticoccus primus]KXU38233.1 hypothetical protein AXK11_00870 [Cephaloticoccus primus]